MSAKNSMEKRKKLLEDGFNAHDNYEETLLKVMMQVLEMTKALLEEIKLLFEKLKEILREYPEEGQEYADALGNIFSLLGGLLKAINEIVETSKKYIAPSASIINHPLNIPPPQAPMFVETVEQPWQVLQNALSDFKKLIQVIENEILRLKGLSDNDENFNNGKKKP